VTEIVDEINIIINNSFENVTVNNSLDDITINNSLDNITINDSLDNITINDSLDNITINDNLDNITINDSLDNITINDSLDDITINDSVENMTEIVDEINITEIISITQGEAEIGKPVRWISDINAVNESLARELIPKNAKIIAIEELQEMKVLTPEMSPELKIYKIEYETPAPEYFQEKISETKERIVISCPENVHYENILAYANLSKEVPEEKIELYRTTGGIKEQVEITKYDLNNNSLIDYIEWIVPHSFNQTYELIIEISAAEHLDEDRIFISDIYDKVYQLDEIWSELIPAEHYVRVTFEQLLDSSRDITLYPRIVSGTPRIEVYEVDGTEIVAEFTSLNSNEYNTVYLTNLISESQDTFDLLVLDGEIEIDHIIDPITWENVSGGSTASLIDGMTWEHDITCGDDMVLIVGIAVDSEPTALVDTITYDSVSLSKVNSTSSSDGEEQAEMWNLTNPNCGSFKTISVTFTNPTTEEAAGISCVYYGVDFINLSSINADSSIGSTSSTLNVSSSSADNWIVNVFALDVDPGSEISVSGDNAVQRGYEDQGYATVA